MKISNFRLIVTHHGSWIGEKEYHASVDVETGYLWWKKTEKLEIRRKYAGMWYFVETGIFTPGFEVENLARAWTAKTGQET